MREMIWGGILEADRLQRYYYMMADKNTGYHQITSFIALAVGSVGVGVAIGATVAGSSEVAAIILGLAFILSLVLHIADYSGIAVAARMKSEQYSQLATDWRRLWYGEPTLEDILELRRKSERIGTGYAIPLDEKLHARAQRDAYLAVPQEFMDAGELEPQA